MQMTRAFRELRRRLLPPLDVRLRRVGGYAATTVLEEGYVGSVEMDVRDLEEVLRALGFRYGYVASLKDRDCPGDDVDVGSWVRRSSLLDPCQLHVHLFSNGDGVIDIYCHHEYTWFRRPLKHYRKQGLRPEKGAEIMQELLDRHGVRFFRRSRDARCGA